jgi:hypothetical protein
MSEAAFGVAEGDPVWWIAVQVGADVASAKATFADGSVDQMAPVDGVAVLAHHITAQVASTGSGPSTVRATLVLLGAGGEVLATVTFPEQPKPMPVPLPAPEPSPAGSGSTGTGSTGSASAGSGSTGSGSTASSPVGSTPGAVVACPQLAAPKPG